LGGASRGPSLLSGTNRSGPGPAVSYACPTATLPSITGSSPVVARGGCGHCDQGRLGFLFVGVLLGGLTWPLSALLIATPDSPWARAFYDGEKMALARREFPRRLPQTQP
jgi:hypothetical protein